MDSMDSSSDDEVYTGGKGLGAVPKITQGVQTPPHTPHTAGATGGGGGVSTHTATHPPQSPPTQSDPVTALDAVKLISDALSETAVDNLAKIKNLLYFSGIDEADRKKFPDKSLEQSPRDWLRSIDNKTAHNWTDAGRLTLVKNFALGSAKKLVAAIEFDIARNSGNNTVAWADFKRAFLKSFPVEKTTAKLSRQLREIQKEDESWSSFYGRVKHLEMQCIKAGFKGKLFSDALADIMRKSLPKAYVDSIVDDSILEDCDALYMGWLKQSQTHPKYLRVENAAKKGNVMNVAAEGNKSKIKSSNPHIQSTKAAGPTPQKNIYSSQSQAPNKTELMCGRCHKGNHETRLCRTPHENISGFKPDKGRGPGVRCLRCKVAGHMAFGCMAPWNKARIRQEDNTEYRCFLCHKPGHKAYECKEGKTGRTISSPAQNTAASNWSKSQQTQSTEEKKKTSM